MVRRAAAFVLGLAFLAAAASAVHATGTPAQKPPWAYGFDKGPAYDEPAPPPQNPPTRALRTIEPIDNQLRPRHLEGSLLTFSLLQTRDAHNVVDWFPGDHPSPMPRVLETDFVPKTGIAGNAFVPIERSRALTEPIGAESSKCRTTTGISSRASPETGASDGPRMCPRGAWQKAVRSSPRAG